MFKHSSILPVVFAIGSVSLSLSACFPEARSRSRTQAPLVQTVTATPASASEQSFTGVVSARVQSDIGFRVLGKVVERLVDVGQSVHLGQPLMRIDRTDFELKPCRPQGEGRPSDRRRGALPRPGRRRGSVRLRLRPEQSQRRGRPGPDASRPERGGLFGHRRRCGWGGSANVRRTRAGGRRRSDGRQLAHAVPGRRRSTCPKPSGRPWGRKPPRRFLGQPAMRRPGCGSCRTPPILSPAPSKPATSSADRRRKRRSARRCRSGSLRRAPGAGSPYRSAPWLIEGKGPGSLSSTPRPRRSASNRSGSSASARTQPSSTARSPAGHGRVAGANLLRGGEKVRLSSVPVAAQ